MKVSIIIPTYNRENYICQAIESALSQTIADIEVIVVDDGSTDGTKNKIKKYQDKIRYIYTENNGCANARNVGLKEAEGQYISFLDSDDLYYPKKSEIQAQLLDKHPDIAMVYTEFSAFDDNGFWDEYHIRKYHSAYHNDAFGYKDIFKDKFTAEDDGIKSIEEQNINIYTGNIFEQYFNQIIVFTNSIMFRKKILNDVGIQNDKFGLFHDHEFVMRICKKYKCAYIDLPTYKLRYHNGQISGIPNQSDINTVIKKQTDMIKVLEAHGIEDQYYYLNNKENVNKRLSIAHKYLSIPLLAMKNDIKKARMNLQKCGYYGKPEKFLWMISYMPYLVRRILLKFYLILEK